MLKGYENMNCLLTDLIYLTKIVQSNYDFIYYMVIMQFVLHLSDLAIYSRYLFNKFECLTITIWKSENISTTEFHKTI